MTLAGALDINLFTIGQEVACKGKACTVVAEYTRTICIEYQDFPFLDEPEDEFPYSREVILKTEAD